MIDGHRLLGFSDALHATWWPQLQEVPGRVLAKNREFSFRSILGILTHMANIEQAWMDVVEGERANWARHSTKTWDELAPVQAYYEESRERTHQLVDGTSGEAWRRECPLRVPGFAKAAFTVEEIVFTVFTHEQFHRGELLAALWSEDIEPPTVDYPRYGTFPSPPG